ncbi:Sulfotransferase domain-containing protein [Micromonospora echinaurantiaca]|uniref:Sulfotransferase domain-containing protein n=1 Tax=Micromonospora echinaurantiaca TaxID=47857 RepID=A0A1C5ICQ8_9ACTN|nr:sulfotransferase domain-containing protein [Micromonospora echinaurantiaca]SCG55781.1 Sulfotransferase domain-containing protein [Micromonospora echinaurantiaca]
MTNPARYRSSEEDSGRWLAFPFRRGDIVISTRSKSGTTWMQMICALLIFQTADLPAPLALLSPWLDWLTAPQRQVYDHLAAQQHRRFIKTHTPLDGVPIKPDVSYIVVARHPLDMAVSLYHQSDNIDRERVRQLTGDPQPSSAPPARPSLRSWLVRWTERDRDPQEALDSLPGVLWHLTDAWRRRGEPNVLLVHYDDLLADLGGQMRRIAAWLGIEVPAERWATLVEAATFAAMRERAQVLVPDALGVLKDHQVFFREGRSGAGQALLSTEELSRYHRRAAEMAPPDLLAWLHRGR